MLGITTEILNFKFQEDPTFSLCANQKGRKTGSAPKKKVLGRNSKFESTNFHPNHSEVLHAKYHDRPTSNFGD